MAARGILNIKPGVLRLQQWPYKIRTSVAGLGLLSWDWHPSIILGIAKAAGNPVRIDERG